MNTKDKRNSRENEGKLLKIIILIISIIGLSLHIVTGLSIYGLGIFGYFTVLSNIAVVFYYIVYFSIPIRISAILKGYILEPILLTGILNWFILVPISIKYYGTFLPLLRPSNIFVHGIIPILVLIDWLLYDEKGIYTNIEPIKWCFFPLLYTVFIYVNEYLGAEGYPYPFYDPKVMGNWNNVFICLIIILFIYILVGYFLYYLKSINRNSAED